MNLAFEIARAGPLEGAGVSPVAGFGLGPGARREGKDFETGNRFGDIIVKRKVFVVEDQEAVREGIIESLNRATDLSVCGEAADVAAALSAIHAAAPDLVLTDLKLKSSNGLDLIRELRRQYPKLPIVAMTMFDPVGHERQSRAAGATGFALKQDGADKLIGIIRAALVD